MTPTLPGVARLFLASAALLGASSCILIPTPEHGLLAGRGAVTAEDTALLKPGTTTREEVLLRFGEPDAVLEGERVFVYEWAVVHGYYFVGAYYTGTGGPIPKSYLLLLAFDPQGVLSRWDLRECVVRAPITLLDEWVRETGAPAPPAPAPAPP